MTSFEALILGIIQGITEFFPVSSSAHLKLGEYFLGMRDLHNYILFDLVCHLGTLLAVIVVLREPIKKILITDRETLWQLCIATLPLFPLVLIMKPIRMLFDQMAFLGICMMLNGCYLAYAVKRSREAAPELLYKRRWRHAAVIGLAQACAIVPGISRSGTTISTAWLLGWNAHSAIIFSFLLSVPTILGGISYELLKLMTQRESTIPSIGITPYLIGLISSFIVGIFGFLILLRLFTKERFRYFAWYCLIIGGAVTLYFTLFGNYV